MSWMALFLLIGSTQYAQADSWESPTSFEKTFENGTIKAQVTVGTTKAHAIATFSRKSNGKWIEVCSGSLVNSSRPVDVIIGSEGKGLVTIDNWEGKGYDHSLVFYRCEKTLRLLKDYYLEDFFSGNDIMEYAPHSVSSRDWVHNVKFEFKGDEFVVKIKSGKEIRFSLSDGSIRR